MTRERAAELLSEVMVLDDPEMAEAHRVAISALRQQECVGDVNKSLTLDELRRMEGQPVYIVENTEYWAIVNSFDQAGVYLLSYGNPDDYGYFGLYGKTWLAYRQKPEEEQEHFREATKKMEPLALDELRKMDGEPVRVVYGEDAGMWALVEVCEESIFLTNNLGGRTEYAANVELEDDGITVYRRKLDEGTV